MRFPIAGLLVASVAMSGCAMFGGGEGEKPNSFWTSGKSSSKTAAAASDQRLTVSPKIPSTEGTVRFATGANDNTSIDLSVKHLPQPSKLTPPASAYVVWTKADKDAKPQNVGALTVDAELTGTLTTLTPLHRFELLVTAEENGQVQEPKGEALLTSTYSR